MAKVFCSEAIFRVVDRSLQVLGGLGITSDTMVERIFRDIRAFRIYDGPSEVHRHAARPAHRRRRKKAQVALKEGSVRDAHLFGVARKKPYADLVGEFRWDIPETFNFGVDVVDAWAAERDGLAIVWENAAGAEISYRFSDIARLSDQLAQSLRCLGVRKGDRVIVMLPRIPEWQIAMIACLKLGAVVIPCIEMLTPRDIEYRVRNSEAKAAICRAEQIGKFADIVDQVPVRVAIGGAPGWLDWQQVIASGTGSFSPEIVAAEDPAIMYYTSGSTGHPKGVLHASRGLYAWRMAAFYWLDLTPEDRIWCTADTGWSKAGTSVICRAHGAAAPAPSCTTAPMFRPSALRLLAKHRVTVFCASGTELNRLASEDFRRLDISALRRTISAGEAVNPSHCRAMGEDDRLQGVGSLRPDRSPDDGAQLSLRTAALRLHGPSAARPRHRHRRRPGQPRSCTARKATSRSEVAEPAAHAALLEGPRAHRRLLRRWTRRHVVPLGRPRHARCRRLLLVRGRADDVINSAGYRIGPLEVENAVLEHASVQECAVVASPDPDRGEIVKAFVVLKDGVAPSPALAKEMQDHVKAVTAPYKYPRADRVRPRPPQNRHRQDPPPHLTRHGIRPRPLESVSGKAFRCLSSAGSPWNTGSRVAREKNAPHVSSPHWPALARDDKTWKAHAAPHSKDCHPGQSGSWQR